MTIPYFNTNGKMNVFPTSHTLAIEKSMYISGHTHTHSGTWYARAFKGFLGGPGHLSTST